MFKNMYTANFKVNKRVVLCNPFLFYLEMSNEFKFKSEYFSIIYYENNMLKLIFQKNYRK